MTAITAHETVGTLAARIPAAAKLMYDHGIDFCCGGERTLEEACVDANQPTEHILDLLEATAEAHGDREIRWEECALHEIVWFIQRRFHDPLKADLPRLVAWSDAVADAHAATTEDPVEALRDAVHELADELTTHMAKEEQVLFPWILSGRGHTAGGPVRQMVREHEDAGRALQRLRLLTNRFRAPAEACETWRALLRELEALDESLRHHIALENNVLFPRALAASPTA